MVRSKMSAFLFLPVVVVMQGCGPAGPPTGTYKVNTFRFVHTESKNTDEGPAPSVWIDTNLKLSSLSGGTYTSSLPCTVKLDYTDSSLTFKSVDVSSVRITYDDGMIDPTTQSLKLPIHIAARDYKAVNSVAGGRIVKSRLLILSGEIRNVVTRARPLRLQIKGHFTKNDGSKLPFSMDERFGIEKETAIKSAEEVLQDK